MGFLWDFIVTVKKNDNQDNKKTKLVTTPMRNACNTLGMNDMAILIITLG